LKENSEEEDNLTKRTESSKAPAERTQNRRTLSLALIGMFAGIYSVGTVALGTASYGLPFNLRLANILIGVVPVIGWPAVFGIALGVFLGNIASPLGPIDLISSVFSLVGLSAIQILRKKSVLAGLSLYSLILSLWVTFELYLVYHYPYFPTFYFTFGGISFVVILLGYFTYKGLVASGLKKRIQSVVRN
jgi:hypothetical protein